MASSQAQYHHLGFPPLPSPGENMESEQTQYPHLSPPSTSSPYFNPPSSQPQPYPYLSPPATLSPSFHMLYLSPPTAYSPNISMPSSQTQYLHLPSDTDISFFPDPKATELGITEANYPEVQRKRGLYRVTALSLITRSRWILRACAVLVALASFILITYSYATFKHADHEGRIHDSSGQQEKVNTTPAVTFSGVGGASFILSLGLLLSGWKSKKMRHVSDLSSAVFAVVSCVSFAAWMSGCFYLSRSSAVTQPLWHWACDEMRHPTVHEYNASAVCNLSTYSWTLGILNAVLDILTFLNVVAGILILRWVTFRRFGFF